MNKYNSLIVSDYDGTIKRTNHLKEFRENISLLNRIVPSKNGFMISTGRLFQSISNEINNYNIPFNYLSCGNGNILFDSNFNLLWNKEIDSLILKELKSYYKYILSLEGKDAYGNITKNNIVEYNIHLINNINIRRSIVNLLLSNELFDYCTDGDNKYNIHIFKYSNKVKTIEILQSLLKIENRDVYTIGDGPNDLEMIKKYNGFILGDSSNKYSDYALKNYELFGDFINDVQHRLIKKRKDI